MDELVKEIKVNHEFRKGEGWEQTLLVEDIDVLIQQAGKVPELESKLKKMAEACSKRGTELRGENKRLKKALEFYGDKKNYEKVFVPPTIDRNGFYKELSILSDGGEKARQELRGECS